MPKTNFKWRVTIRMFLYFTKDKTCFVKENDLWTIIKKLI